MYDETLHDDEQDRLNRLDPSTSLNEANVDDTRWQADEDQESAAKLSKQTVGPSAPPGYEIAGELGRGGMGVVYLARDVNLHRLVAIKMILGGQYTHPAAQARFLVEAEAVAMLSHPCIVQVYEFGRHLDQPFFALEYIDGGSLATRIRTHSFSSREATRLMLQLAEAISAAHAKGVVHRDLKPGNILLTASGAPKIVDFGLAKIGQSDLTVTGAIMGTPSYMSPEQAAGRTSDIGTASDIYSLGAIFFEMLTGRTPFIGKSASTTIQLVLTAQPPRLRSISRALPRDLETIVEKCLLKDPYQRYSTAESLAYDLRAFLEGRPIRVRPISTAERIGKWMRRNPGRALAGIASIVIAISFGLLLQHQSAQRKTDQVLAETKLEQQRIETRAESLVQALLNADTASVPFLVSEMTEFRDSMAGTLRQTAMEPIETKHGLHARLALIPSEPIRSEEVIPYLLKCKPQELKTLCVMLTERSSSVAPALWETLLDHRTSMQERGRAASALARWNSKDSRWQDVAEPIVEWIVQENPIEVEYWATAMHPIGDYLIPPLVARYRAARQRLDSEQIKISDLVAEASAYEITARLLAQFAAMNPATLADLAQFLDVRHVPYFHEALASNIDSVAIHLKDLIQQETSASDDPLSREAIGMRRANAAATLLMLGKPKVAWPLLKHGPDCTTRSHLMMRLGEVVEDPAILLTMLNSDTDISLQRSIVLVLGDLRRRPLSEPMTLAIENRLTSLFQSHQDTGIHSAIEWYFASPADESQQSSFEEIERIKGVLCSSSIPTDRNWFVNQQGHTYSIVRGPVEFSMGSPPIESDRFEDETLHRKRIDRSFAIATHEVSRSEYAKFNPKYEGITTYSPSDTCPVVGVHWFDAVAYCNWLSHREGIPENQWCYLPNDNEEYAERMQIKPNYTELIGYRLPTEAEWEYACRASSTTARYFGHGDKLLDRYVWYLQNAQNHTWPVGSLRPNDLGLFDMLGNAIEWVNDPSIRVGYDVAHIEDNFLEKFLVIENRPERFLRGGSFLDALSDARAAYRNVNRPDVRYSSNGFRTCKTILFSND